MSDTIHVLHVDDEPDLSDMVATFLEREDDRLDVQTTTSPTDGLDILADHEIDCIVSDYDMPRMSGIEFLDSVREEYPDLPFILYTGKGSEEVASEAISKDATDYLQKGSGTEQYELLANRIRNAVRQYRSTQEAKQTRRRLQNLAESTPHCVWMFDPEWEELLFISGYEEVWDRPIEAIRDNPQDFLNGVHPEDREFVQNAMERMSDGDAIDIEYRILRGGSETGWVWVQGEPVFDDDGAVRSVVGFTRDVTDRKQREQELERYERIIENLPVGVFRTTPDGDFIDVNEQYISLLGADSKADLTDVGVRNFWTDTADRQRLLRQLDQEGTVKDRQVEIETLDGESKWVETTLQITEEEGIRYLDGIVYDVTERRERQRRLKQAETMFENAQDALFLIDANEEFTIERVNPAYEEATGFSKDALSGRTPRELLGDDQGDEIEQKYEECVDKRTPFEYEEELSIDGDRTYWETRIAPVVIDGVVEKIVGATRDITERKEREQRYNAIFNQTYQFTGLLEPDGTLVEANETALEFGGIERDDVIGKKMWEATWFEHSQETRERARKAVKRAADGEFVRHELPIKGDDREVIIDFSVRPVTNDDGEVTVLIPEGRDITARKERERELQQYEAYLEESSDIITVLDDTGTITYQSPAVKRILGYDREEFIGQNGFDYIHPDDVDEVWETFTDLVAEPGATVTVECRFRTVDDEWRWLEVRGTNRLEHDPINGIVTNNRDITERKEREQEFKQTSRQLKAVLDTVEAAIFIKDTDGRYQLMNQECRRLLGADPDEDIAGLSDHDFLPEDTATQYRADDQRVIETGETIELEEEVPTPEGVQINRTLKSPFYNDDDELIGICAVSTDITEQKQREQQLKHYEGLIETLPIGYVRTSFDDEFLDMNSTFVEMLDGSTKEDVRSHAVSQFYRDSTTRDQLLATLREEGKVDGEELKVTTLSDDTIWITVTGRVVGDDDGKPYIDALVQDVTERKEGERELQRKNERLEEFASIVSHDLRNPLNVAEGRLALVAEECDSDHLEHVDQALDRMDALIEDLLTLAYEGESITDLESIDLAVIAEGCWATVETGEATLVTTTDRTVYADESRLKQLFENLVRNAVEHGGDNVTVTIGEVDDGFYIEDDGSGIPETEREAVFDAGYSTSDEGTGFGLNIVKQVAEAHNWEISVTDGSEGGARFEFTGVNIVDE